MERLRPGHTVIPTPLFMMVADVNGTVAAFLYTKAKPYVN
jgi:hypothetical protein